MRRLKEKFMDERLRINFYYGLDSSFSGGYVMRSLEIVRGMRVRHIVDRMGLEGVSYYLERGVSFEILGSEHEFISGRDYFMHARDRRRLNNDLKSWKIILRGILEKIEEERRLGN